MLGVIPYLSEFTNITDPLTLHGAEVGGDTAVLEIHHAGERLIEQRPNREDREVPCFGLNIRVRRSTRSA